MNELPLRQPFLPQPPIELINSENPIDLKVFYVCMLLENSRPDQPFELPGRAEMARMCGCSTNTLEAAYRRLNQTPYFQLIDRGEKRQRRLVRVKYFAIPTMAELVVAEGTELMKGETMKSSVTARRSKDGGTDVTLHNTYSPTPELIAFHKQASTRDTYGNSLAGFELRQLWERCGRPDNQSLLIACHEVERFKPVYRGKREEIGNVLSLLVGRFLKDDAGHPTGKLNPRRPNTLSMNELKPKRSTVATRDDHYYTIYPTEEYTAQKIDDVCQRLNNGKSVFKGECPIYFTELVCLDTQHGNQFVLGGGVECLEQEKPGYWACRWKLPKNFKPIVSPLGASGN